MQKVNYKSDFDLVLRLLGCADGGGTAEIGWPDFDWEARLFTDNPANAFVAECRGGVCRGCFNDDGKIHIVVKNHHIGPGRLKVEFKALLPNKIYPDGIQKRVAPQPLEVELVRGRGDCCKEDLEADVFTACYFIHDTDVYNSVLKAVNKALEELLAGNIRPTAPGTAVAAGAPKGDPLCGRVVRRGFMPSGAMPGEVYVGSPDDSGSTTVEIRNLESKGRRDITALLGGDVSRVGHSANCRIEQSADGTITAVWDPIPGAENPRAFIYIRFVDRSGQEYDPRFISRNAEGCIVAVPDRGIGYRTAAPWVDNAGLSINSNPVRLDPVEGLYVNAKEASDGIGRREYAYAMDSVGNRYEVQWKRTIMPPKKVVSRKAVKKWRKFCKWRDCGVFRARRVTRGRARSEWMYFSTYIDAEVQRVIVRI